MRRKEWFAVLIVVVIIIILSFFPSPLNTDDKNKELTIGAILPLSGPSAIWGENIKNGMELAKKDLEKEGIGLNVVYEDSKADPNEGINAYNKLVNIDDVDVIFSAFSRVSVPLVSLSDNDKVPLIMTAVAVDGITDQSPYAFRFFADAKTHATTHFDTLLSKGYNQIGVLYINDEYGVSVREYIEKESIEKGIEISNIESYAPGDLDFRTQLLKIKSSKPNAIMVVVTNPSEIINVVKQVKELDIDAYIFEASFLLSLGGVRQSLGNLSEGVYTLSFEKVDDEFNDLYISVYGEPPFFAAGFGFDMVEIVGKASKQGNGDLKEDLIELKEINGVSGNLIINTNGEINPKAKSVRIVDGELNP